MARPYIHWDPSVNASLHVTSGQGPLTVDSAINPEAFPLIVSKSEELNFWYGRYIDYIQELSVASGTPPHDGLKVLQSQYMPYGARGDLPSPYEPMPLDDMNTTSFLTNPLYVTLGWRMQLRGYIGSGPATDFAADIKVKWADRDVRNGGDSRGGISGVLVRPVFNQPGVESVFYEGFGLLHGKTPTTLSDWSRLPLRFGPSSGSYGTTAVDNGIDNGFYRIVMSGGGSSSLIRTQYWDGGAWVETDAFAKDIIGDAPAIEDWRTMFMIRADLFSGQNRRDAPPPSKTIDPDAVTWFSFIETDQFEPFVIDVADWSYRDFSRLTGWLVPGEEEAYREAAVETKLPKKDLIHNSPPLRGSPTNLRVSDPDLGICVEFNELTWLRSEVPWDQYGVSVTSVFSPVLMDENRFSFQLPFAMSGRFKFQSMETWSQSFPVYIMSAGSVWSATPSTLNGIGIFWQYTGPNIGDGKLVLRAYDNDAVGWVDAEFQFNANDWDDRPVELAWAWSGAKGDTVGRDNYELRLVVDGVTRASTVNGNIRVIASVDMLIGSMRGVAYPTPDGRAFTGLFREAMVFIDALTDQDIRTAWVDTVAFDNPSFETAGQLGRPGEAASWFWSSFETPGLWAGFNEYHDRLIQWATAFEEFGAGFHQPYTWVYADSTARLAAGGFVAGDVSGMGWQQDDDTKWILTNHSPITWVQAEVGTNEDWLEAFVQVLYAVFNLDVSTYEATQEEFAIWSFPSAPSEWQFGPPWRDSLLHVQPYQDTLNAATDGAVPLEIPTGLRGALDHITGLMEYPLEVDEFGEGWGTDPLSTAIGPMWLGGQAVNGKLNSRALQFPVEVVYDRRFLTIYLDELRLVILELTPGTYADAMSLASMLTSKWQPQVGSDTGIGFSDWSSGAASGVSFGWDNNATALFSGMAMFAKRALSEHNDARVDIGLDQLGPGGITGKVIMPAAAVDELPAGVGGAENFYLDPWSLLMFDMMTDPYSSSEILFEYDTEFVVFGVLDGAPDPTVFERFTLEGWFGAGVYWWGPSWSGPFAMFDSGSVDTENFVNSNWPDYPYPTP